VSFERHKRHQCRVGLSNMSETISPKTTIAQYTIVSRIGEGGMGECRMEN